MLGKINKIIGVWRIRCLAQIENVYLPEEKKIVTLFFDVCECPACEISVLIERKLPVES